MLGIGAGRPRLEAKSVGEEPEVSAGVCRCCCCCCCWCGSEALVLHAVQRGARVHTACLHTSIAVMGGVQGGCRGGVGGGWEGARSDDMHVFPRLYCILLLRLLFFFTLARKKKAAKEGVSLVVFKVGFGEPRGVPRENSRGPQQNNGPVIFHLKSCHMMQECFRF